MANQTSTYSAGVATAYGAAVRGGYTGTYAEFCAQQAQYADNAAAVEQAKEDAQAAATAATTKAGEAGQSATAAAGSATAAAGSATAAAGSATTAAGSATTAGSKATEAAASATAAGQAKTAAETAQGAAETAKTGAETAAASVEASAAQIAQNTADISLVKSHLDAIDIVDTANGAIATFADGSDGIPVESLMVTMEPIQDLHGQANPYPAGGGKNLIPYPYIDGASLTIKGITFTVDSQGVITANGTASENAEFTMISTSVPINLEAGDYTLSGLPSGGGASSFVYNIFARDANNNLIIDYRPGVDRTFTVSSAIVQLNIGVRIIGGYTASNLKICPQFEKGSTATAFAPYSNICPISGRQSVTVTRAGVNVWDEEWESGSYDVNGRLIADPSRIRTVNPISVVGGTSYYIKAPNTLGIRYYDINDVFISSGYSTTVINNTSVAPDNAAYLRFSVVGVTTYGDDISINYPSSDHGSHPGTVQSVTIPLGQTVYGGTVDVVSGEMVVDRAMVDLETLNWTYASTATYPRFATTNTVSGAKGAASDSDVANGVCSIYALASVNEISRGQGDMILSLSTTGYVWVRDSSKTDLASFLEAVTGQMLCYELAESITVQLTPEQLTTVLGVNNVWSDADSVTVDYVADTKLYIQKAISAAVAALS